MNPIMMRLSSKHEISYPIIVEPDLLNRPYEWLLDDSHDKQLVIITDDEVKKHYGDRLLQTLKKSKPLLLSFSPGEQSKNYRTKEYLEEQMLKHGCDRDTIILSLGGGVVGDMAGFVASTYMRGISYIQIPTTLLAMADSSVGGKTGINHSQGKNLIGAFWQPLSVVIDTDCLTTLPQTQIINGFIEILKMFITSGKDNIRDIHHTIAAVLKRDKLIFQKIIRKAINIKVAIVSQDEKESHLRKILNFGHTIGHALEKVTDYSVLHGYAVGLGILVEAKISQLLGILSKENYLLIQAMLQQLSIVGSQLKKYSIENIIQATNRDKKNKAGYVKYVLLKEPGKVVHENDDVVHSVSDNVVRAALLEVREIPNDGQ